MSLLSSYVMHAVSLPAFFADGFRLASPSSSTMSWNNDDWAAEPPGGKTTTLKLRVGSVEYTAGVKRPRSSSDGTSTHDTTPHSEYQGESVDFINHTDDTDKSKLFPTIGTDGSLLLEPKVTSLLRMGPSGSWLNTSLTPSTPEEGKEGMNDGELQATFLSNDSVKTAVSGELAPLLRAALEKCYKTEDELLRQRRDEEVKKEGEAYVYMMNQTQEEEENRITTRHHLASLPGSFERVVNHIQAQKRRRRQQSERLEDQARDIARVKELPLLVEDAVRYARLVVEWSCKSGGRNSGVCHAKEDVTHSDETILDNPCVSKSTVSNSSGTSGSDNRETSQMLYAKFPPPLFQTSSFAAGVGRLLRWIRTWQRASPSEINKIEPCRRDEKEKKQSNRSKTKQVIKETTPNAVLNLQSVSCRRQGRSVDAKEGGNLRGSETGEKEGNDDTIFMGESKKTENRYISRNSALQRYYGDWIRTADRMHSSNGGHTTLIPSCADSPSEAGEDMGYGLASDYVRYDEYGNCLRSVRLARKMAEKRALQDEAQKTREQRRGYFAREEEHGRPTRRALFDADAFSGGDDTSTDSDDDVTNIAVLHGPCGVGKTAIVYLVAEILGYRVVEMNTSVRRCPKNIELLLSEVTRSRRLSALASGKAMVSIEEELKKLKSEHLAASEAISSVKANLGRKKSNCISAEAVAAFFRPRKKTQSTDVVLVDTNSSTAETTVVSSEQAVNRGGGKRNRENGEVLVDSEVKSETAKVVTGRGHEDATRALILFDDADVVLGDEAMKPFYAAVRQLAQRSKVPIVVTVSSSTSAAVRSTASTTADAVTQDADSVQTVSMGAAQAAQFFGKQTPFTGIDPMSRSALFTQLLVVAAVERGLIVVSADVAVAVTTSVHHTEVMEKVEGALHKNSAVTVEPASPVTSQGSVMVRDVVGFQRLADAVRREVYNGGEETEHRAFYNPMDMRWWLNRLQYLLLEEQWPVQEMRTAVCNSSGNGDARCDLPTHHEGQTNAMEAHNVQSYWDAQLGRVLRASESMSKTYSFSWEWKQLQYAEEIAAIGYSNEVLGNNDISGDVYISNSSNVEPPSVLSPGSSLSTEFIDVLRGAVPDDVLDRCRSVIPVNGAHNSSTSKRIEAFGGWWRRTRKADAIKLFVAARSSNAYEDVIGFSCLLQQQPSPMAKAHSV